MWSITTLAPTLQQVVGAGADMRMKRDEYIEEMGKLEEARYLEEFQQGKRVAYLMVLFSSNVYQFSQSIYYQTLRHILVIGAFFTIGFAVNGSINTQNEANIYDACNYAIDTCFVVHGVVQAFSSFTYAQRLRNYDILNARMGAYDSAEIVVRKYTVMKVFKNSGLVDFVIGVFCLAYNGQQVADWFRLVRIIIISVWALENEPRIGILLSGIAHGFKAMISLLVLMLLVNVIFAAISITTFAENDPYNFGSMSVAMWSLVEMSTMEGWSLILDINKEGCDSVPESQYEMRTNTSTLSIIRYGGEFYMPVCSNPQSQPFEATIIFLLYIVIVGFILTSITLGAIATGINERFDDLKGQQVLELEETSSDGEDDGGTEGNKSKPGKKLLNERGLNSETSDVKPDCVAHHEIYDEQDKFSFNKSLEMVKAPSSESRDNSIQEISSFASADGKVSDVPPLKFSTMSIDELKKTNLFRKPTMRYHKTSHVDQFSFRTCKDVAHQDEEYDVFTTEVQECLDIINLEREVNQQSGKKPVARSKSSNYLRGQLAKTASGIKKSDLRLNKMKSKSFHIFMYKFKKFIYGDTYSLVMLAFIFVAAMFEIATLSNPNENFHHTDKDIYKIQLFIQLVFSLDILLRFVAMFPRYHNFLFYQWNMFDFIIVLVLWLPFVMNILEKYIRLLRVLRLVALIKFMKWIPQLAYILDAIISSGKLLIYSVLLMAMCFYYFAVAGVLLFEENDYEHFGKLHTSFLSMVSVATFDNWAEICRINMYGCDMLGYDTGDAAYDAQCTSPHGRGWWASLYFFIFIIVENYILMNLLISIIMTSMEISYKNSKEVDKMWIKITNKKEKYQISNLLMKKILAVFVILDFNSSCSISLAAAAPLFEYLNITEHSEVLEIFNKIDEDKEGSIDYPEFIELLFFLEKRQRNGKRSKGKTNDSDKLKEDGLVEFAE